GSASAPRPRSSAARSVSAPSERPTSSMNAPSAAATRAISRPMPDEAPVTTMAGFIGPPSAGLERLGAGRLAGGVERDLLHARLGLAQQFLAAALERLAALVDRHRFLERH